MADESIVVQVRSDGAKVVSRDIQEIGEKAEGSAKGVEMLKGMLEAVGVAWGLREIIEISSAWTDFNSRLINVTGSAANAKATMEQLSEIANRNYQDIDMLTESFLQNSIGMKQMGKSTQEQLQFQGALSDALTVSAIKGERAQAVTSALSRAMVAGKVSGHEWKTILEQGGRIVTALADGTGKSIAQLNQMARKGELTGDTIFTALTSQAKKLEEESMKMPPTMGDALVKLKNHFKDLVGEFMNSTGAANAWVQVFDVISNHLDIFIRLVALVVIPLTLFTAGVRLATIATNLWSAALKMTPIGWVVTILTVAITAWELFKDKIMIGVDAFTSIGDVGRAVWEKLIGLFTGGGTALASMWETVKGYASAFFNWLDNATGGAITTVMNWFSSMFQGTDKGFAGIVEGAARMWDRLQNGLEGLRAAWFAAWSALPELVVRIFTGIYNDIMAWVAKWLNPVIEGINKIKTAVGGTAIDLIKVDTNVDKTKFEDYGKTVMDAFNKGFKDNASNLEGTVKGVFDSARRIGAKRFLDGQGAGKPDLGQHGVPMAGADDEKKAKGADKLANALRSLLNTISPIQGAYLEMAKAEKTLNEAEAKGLINAPQHQHYLDLLKDHYRDIIYPMDAYNRELLKQIGYDKMSTDEAEIAQKMDALKKSNREKDITLSKQQYDIEEQLLRQAQQSAKDATVRRGLLEGLANDQDKFNRELKIMNELVSSKQMTKEDSISILMKNHADLFADTRMAFDELMKDYQKQFAQLDNIRKHDLISDTQYTQAKNALSLKRDAAMKKETLDLINDRLRMNKATSLDLATKSLDALTQGFISFEKSASDAIDSFCTSMNDGISNSIGQAITGTKSLGDAMYEVAQGAVQQLISAIIKAGLQWVENLIMQKVMGEAVQTEQAGGAVAAGSAIASAYSPAAAMVSLATYGSNAVAASAGIGATVTLAHGLALSGFKTGGYTGDGALDDIAGFVHGREFVMNADATAANRPALEAMNRGASAPPQTAPAPNMNVHIENHGTSKGFQVQQLSEGDIRIIARDEASTVTKLMAPDVVAGSLNNPNSSVSKSMTRHINAPRRR